MSTFQSSLYAKQLAGLKPGPAPGLKFAVYRMYASVALPNTLAANDLIDFFELPTGAKIVDWALYADQLDSNGSPTLLIDVGDGISGSATDIYSSSTVGHVAAGSWDRQPKGASIDVQYTAPVLIQGKVHTVAATKAAGNIALTCWFLLPGNPSSLSGETANL